MIQLCFSSNGSPLESKWDVGCKTVWETANSATPYWDHGFQNNQNEKKRFVAELGHSDLLSVYDSPNCLGGCCCCLVVLRPW